MGEGPVQHGNIPFIGPAIARLLVGPEVKRAKLLAQIFEHLNGITNADGERHTQCCQRLTQVTQRVMNEVPVPT